jgi:hypothetical protein
MFKLLRLLRFQKLLNQSTFVNGIWEILNVETALMLKFTFLIGLFSHWIACLWGLIAFIEAKSFGDPMYTSLNWISNWYVPLAQLKQFGLHFLSRLNDLLFLGIMVRMLKVG